MRPIRFEVPIRLPLAALEPLLRRTRTLNYREDLMLEKTGSVLAMTNAKDWVDQRLRPSIAVELSTGNLAFARRG